MWYPTGPWLVNLLIENLMESDYVNKIWETNNQDFTYAIRLFYYI
jgi:hypothetical protein